MTGYHHGHTFWNSRPNHIPDSSSPEIVKQPYTNTGIRASLFPCLVKTLNFISAISVKKNIGQQRLINFPFIPLFMENLFELIVKVDRPSLIIFGFPNLEPDNAIIAVNLFPGQSSDFRDPPSGFIPEGNKSMQKRGYRERMGNEQKPSQAGLVGRAGNTR